MSSQIVCVFNSFDKTVTMGKKITSDIQACLIIQKAFRKSLIVRFNLKSINKVDKCTICLEETSDLVQLSCKHRFHTDCILKWFLTQKNTCCPCCRSVNTVKKGKCFTKIVDIPVDLIIENTQNVIYMKDVYDNCGCDMGKIIANIDHMSVSVLRTIMLEFQILTRFGVIEKSEAIESRKFLNCLISILSMISLYDLDRIFIKDEILKDCPEWAYRLFQPIVSLLNRPNTITAIEQRLIEKIRDDLTRPYILSRFIQINTIEKMRQKAIHIQKSLKVNDGNISTSISVISDNTLRHLRAMGIYSQEET